MWRLFLVMQILLYFFGFSEIRVMLIPLIKLIIFKYSLIFLIIIFFIIILGVILGFIVFYLEELCEFETS